LVAPYVAKRNAGLQKVNKVGFGGIFDACPELVEGEPKTMLRETKSRLCALALISFLFASIAYPLQGKGIIIICFFTIVKTATQ